jgi:NADPH2:quinone reductase
MAYITTNGSGEPDVLVPATGKIPEPGADEVLIRVLAAGVNRPDVAQRQGHYPPPPGASPIIGLEVAGEVVGHGTNAKRWRLGDKVCALTNGGAYAQYCVAPETQCLPWPAGYDAIQAAALPENAFTVWANLFQAGRLQPGETALVHGGTSGIGITAIQLAKAFGARIYATAGSAEKCAACERLGATAAINYRSDDFAQEIKRLTDGRGVNVVLDMVGAPYAQRNLRCLAMDGRLVFIAFLGGPIAEKFDFTTIMTKRLVLTGSTMRPRTTAQKAAIATELLDRVWPLLEEGRCRPVIHEVFPLEQAAAAHRLMESSQHIGKIMLEVAR